eukprot:6204931-Pleurochrysis_carterae.AAC.1
MCTIESSLAATEEIKVNLILSLAPFVRPRIPHPHKPLHVHSSRTPSHLFRKLKLQTLTADCRCTESQADYSLAYKLAQQF